MNFQGTCVNSFDCDGYSIISAFRDTSDFACVLEESIEIDRKTFNLKIGAMDNEISAYDEFFWNEERKICFGYECDRDIHYFYF